LKQKIAVILLLAAVAVLQAAPAMAENTNVTGIIPLGVSGITVSSITTTSAAISWTTNSNSTSQLVYALSSYPDSGNYTYQTAEDASLVTSHGIALFSLAAGTTYHYRVRSTIPADSLVAVSDDLTFTTAASIPPPGDGGGGGGGPISTSTPVNLVNLRSSNALIIGPNGAVKNSVTLVSEDGSFTFDIPAGTTLQYSTGSKLTNISVSGVTSKPSPPPGGAIVFAYNFEPDGATFNPPLTLTIRYDPASLPAGTNEKELYVAWWDGSRWQAIGGVVYAVSKTVSVQVSHFTQYALLSKNVTPATPALPVLVPPPTAVLSPAKFTIAGLNIAPSSVKSGEIVTVTATVTNSGGSQGVYAVDVRINGVKEETKELTFAAGATDKVSFTVKKSAAGTYAIDVNGLTGTFNVSEEAEPLVQPVDYAAVVRWTLVGVSIFAGIVAYFLWRRLRNQIS